MFTTKLNPEDLLAIKPRHDYVFSIGPITYSPMVLSYTNKEQGRGWCLDFRSLPKPEIIFTGDAPTTDELVEVLGPMNAPTWLIGVLKVVVSSVSQCQPTA